MDINDIKAGEYQLVAQRWDEPTSKPGEPFTFRRHRQGDKVKLSESDARRLVVAGAVVKPGELERRAAATALAQYKAALALVPDDLREHVQAPEQVVQVLTQPEPSAAPVIEKPTARRQPAPKD